MTLTINVVENEHEFAAMRDEWTELLSSSSADTIFLSWEWLHTWWNHFGAGRRLFIVTARSAARLVAIAPLVVRRVWVGPVLVPILEFAGTGTIGSDYLDIIVRRDCENEAVNALVAFLARGRMSMRLPRISESSGLARFLATGLDDLGWTSIGAKTEVCPFIDLNGLSFDEYLGTLGSSHRYNFKRRLRNLTRDHDVEVAYAVTDDERREMLAHVVDLHLRRWNPRGGSDAFNGAEVLAFHEEFSGLAQQRGWLRLFVIRIDGQAAAAFYGFRYGHRFHFYQSGFDPQFVRSSVGLVLIGLSIRDAIAEGAAEYDMLHGDESYKFLWSKTLRQLIRLDVYPPGGMGLIHRNATRLTAATKRAVKRALHVEPRPALETT